jgi:phage gp29-like protein
MNEQNKEAAKAGVANEPDVNPAFQSLVTPVEMQRSFYTSVNKILRQGSLAFRSERALQKQMRNDPDVMGPLLSLQLSVACADWAVAVQPDFAGDEQAVEQAATIEKLLRNTPRITDLMRHLLDAMWYGRSAVNMVFGRSEDMTFIRDWLPIHGDSIVITEYGTVGIKVGPRYYAMQTAESGNTTGKIGDTIIGWDSRVLPLDQMQRATIALHTFQPQGVDFDDPYEAENAYLGRGMRDLIWYYWKMKQRVLQNWDAYCERYGMGFRIGTYPMGNMQAREEMDSILAQLMGDVSVTIPKDPNATEQPFDIKLLEPSSSNAETFAKMVEYLSGNIKEIILGQTGTSEAINSGLGSSVADQHAQTFNRQMTYIANALAETMTREIVEPLYRMNFGDEGVPPQFSFSVSKPNPDEYMKAIEMFTKLGGRVSEREARKVFGLSEPEDEETVLQAPAEPGMSPLDVRPMNEQPEAQEQEETEVSEQPKFGKDRFAVSDVDLKPTSAMASNATRGLELRKKWKRGGTAVGVARARDLANRKTLSPSTVRRMHSYFSRHEVDKEGKGWGKNSAGYIAWLLWGGDAGQRWAASKSKQLDKAQGKSE